MSGDSLTGWRMSGLTPEHQKSYDVKHGCPPPTRHDALFDGEEYITCVIVVVVIVVTIAVVIVVRQRDKSGHGKNPNEKAALTNWRTHRGTSHDIEEP
jgi:hypothetical protein